MNVSEAVCNDLTSPTCLFECASLELAQVELLVL